MLSPNHRSLYTSALTPSPGWTFDEAIGATFSMDPSLLLTVPVHLALLARGQQDPLRDGIAVLESVRRLADRITVYAQRGRLLVPPGPPNPLYGLLEQMTVEVTAPGGGVFHPKLWLLRFVDGRGASMLRLLVLSRNLTRDRSWDMALTLEGRPSESPQPRNEPLADLVARLPELAFGELEPARREQARRLAEELRFVRWELPGGFGDLSFHVLGLDEGGWSPPGSTQMAIISPFCTDEALAHLSRRTSSAAALISRRETLLALAPETRARFGRCLVLDEAAETEDGEETGGEDGGQSWDTLGLHAKVYVCQKGWYTWVIMGSANATNAALLRGSNVEILAALKGKRKSVGTIEQFLGPEQGLGEVLTEVEVPEEAVEVDAARVEAEAALERARRLLAEVPMRLVCEAVGEGTWQLTLEGLGARAQGLASAWAWPITVGRDHGAALWQGEEEGSVRFGRLSAQSVTGLVAFELIADGGEERLRFVLNLPVEGLPEARDAAILQTVVRNQDGFLRYLLLLLGEVEDAVEAAEEEAAGAGAGFWSSGGVGGRPLLEELVRAYSRAPERLREVGRVVERLTERSGGEGEEAVVPPEFLELWQTFERAMEGRDDC